MNFSRLLMASVSGPALALAAFLLSGCAVGPDYTTPAAPEAKAYAPDGLPGKTAGIDSRSGAEQQFVAGSAIPAAWWELFRSTPLNKLLVRALEANPDLLAARASLREAEENLYAGEGAFFPSLDGSAGATRQKTSNNGSSGGNHVPYTLYNTSVSLSFPLDVFGGIRREVEGLEALKEMQRFELEAAYITLTGNVVTAAIQEASLRAQIVATQEIVASERKQLDLLKKQFDAGAVAKAAVLAQQTSLAQTLATLPPLEKQLAQTRHELSALAGQLPSEDLGATFDLADLHLPETLPVSLPSQLVEQRPDIKAATAQLHAATAAVGVATANMLPQITLTGGYGISATQLASLFSPGTALWSFGAGLLQPIFHGGELLHKKRASEAGLDRAMAQYQSTVLAAFQNVADALRAVQSDAEAYKAQVTAERAAADSLKLAEQQYAAGAISYLSLLTSQQALEQTKIARAQAEARRYADTAALFIALGGGWWNRDQEAGNAEAVPVEQNTEKEKETQAPGPLPLKRYNFGRRSL